MYCVDLGEGLVAGGMSLRPLKEADFVVCGEAEADM